jgi:hypothetical protein
MVLIDFIESFGQGFVTSFVSELALVIKDRLRKVFPDFIPHALSRKLARGFFEIAPEFVVSFWPAGETDNLHSWWKVAIGREIV